MSFISPAICSKPTYRVTESTDSDTSRDTVLHGCCLTALALLLCSSLHKAFQSHFCVISQQIDF